MAALPDSSEGARRGCVPEEGQAADLDVWPADLPGQAGALLEVALRLAKSDPPLNGAEVQERHSSQLAGEGEILFGLTCDRGLEEANLFRHPRKVTTPPRHRHVQQRDSHPQTTLTLGLGCLHVVFGDCKQGARLVETSPDHGAPGPDQSQL